LAHFSPFLYVRHCKFFLFWLEKGKNFGDRSVPRKIFHLRRAFYCSSCLRIFSRVEAKAFFANLFTENTYFIKENPISLGENVFFSTENHQDFLAFWANASDKNAHFLKENTISLRENVFFTRQNRQNFLGSLRSQKKKKMNFKVLPSNYKATFQCFFPEYKCLTI